jgi:hypothetical protein
MLWIAMASLLGGLASAQAQPGRSAGMSDRDIQMRLEMGQELEASTRGDLNGDRAADTAFVASSPDARFVHTMLGGQVARQAGILKLEPNPHRPARLRITNGVLAVEDESGGTVAMAATYRYRLDPRAGRMRLIGLDARLFYRTFENDGFEMSWNLVTGDLVTRVLRPARRGGRQTYEPAFEQHSKRSSRAVYMEQTPDPEMVMIDIRRR